jgi:Spy/CpxP family protein refolding chaperone
MRKYTTTLVLASALVALVAAAPALYAEHARTPSGPMMGRGMMGMMGQMDQMMDHCSTMMRNRGNGGGRPNDQWRKHAPMTPDKND